MKPGTAVALTVAHLHVDGFAVAAERHARPALAGRPVVVGGAPGSWGRVVAVSPEAGARGVAPGQPLREAVRRCPHAAFLPGDIERQHELRALADEIVRSSVRSVAWTAIDEAVLDLTAAGPAAARRLAENLQRRLHDALGLAVAIGIASRPMAARAAARLARPRGLVVVLPGYDDRFFSALPIDELDVIDPRALARLRAHGILTVGQLAAWPVEQAVSVLGREGGALVRLAAGEGDVLPVPQALPRRVCRQRAFAHPPAALDEPLASAIADLSTALRNRGWAAATIGVRVEDEAGASRAHALPLAEPTAEAPQLLHAARRLLARATPLSQRVRLLSVSASGLVPAASPQGELFDGGRRPAAARASWRELPRPARRHPPLAG